MQRTDVCIDNRTLARLHQTSGAAGWAVSLEALGEALCASVAHRFDTVPLTADLDAYLASLHASDLALACACRAGHDGAWEHFIRELRPALYASARTIAGDDGRDLADSLYAELFGLPGPDGERRSLLAYYHGRSRLITWLRSVMVQRLIDRRRAHARFEALDDDEPLQATTAASAADPERQRLSELAQNALDAAIDTLDAQGSSSTAALLRPGSDARPNRPPAGRVGGHRVTQAGTGAADTAFRSGIHSAHAPRALG